MARIPIIQSNQQLPRQSGLAQADSRVMGAPAAAFGEVADAAKQFALREQETMNTLALGKAEAEAQTRLSQLRADLLTAPLDQVEGQYEENAKAIYESLTDGMNSAVKRDFENRWSRYYGTAAVNVRADRRERVVDQANSTYLSNRQTVLKHMATLSPTNPEFVAGKDALTRQIDAMVSAGAMTAEAGEKERQSVLSDIDEIKVRQLMREEPIDAEAALADPAQFQDLNPETRERLATQANNLADAVREDRVRAFEDWEDRQQDILEENQDALETELTGVILEAGRGDPTAVETAPTVQDIYNMQESRRLSPDGAKRLLKLRFAEISEENSFTFAGLTEDIYELSDLPFDQRQGAKKMLQGQLQQALADGEISKSEFDSRMSLIARTEDDGFSRAKQGRTFIKRAFGVDEQGSFFGGKSSFERQLGPLMGEALYEYELRVDSARRLAEDGNPAPSPLQIARDIVDRTVGSELELSSVPAPRYGPKNEGGQFIAAKEYGQAELSMAKTATAQAAARGEISGEELMLEQERLQRIEMFLRLQSIKDQERDPEEDLDMGQR